MERLVPVLLVLVLAALPVLSSSIDGAMPCSSSSSPLITCCIATTTAITHALVDQVDYTAQLQQQADLGKRLVLTRPTTNSNSYLVLDFAAPAAEVLVQCTTVGQDEDTSSPRTDTWWTSSSLGGTLAAQCGGVASSSTMLLPLVDGGRQVQVPLPVHDELCAPRRSLATATTKYPTKKPTKKRTTKFPTKAPTAKPIKLKHTSTLKPTRRPTTKKPSKAPTSKPTKKPTQYPTSKPSKTPTVYPTTDALSSAPTRTPTFSRPTTSPSTHPTREPTTPEPTQMPTTPEPTAPTTFAPSTSPTTPEPTTLRPTSEAPTERPTKAPTTAEPFKIEFMYQNESSVTTEMKAAFTAAAARWSGIISTSFADYAELGAGTYCGVKLEEDLTIQDLVIAVSVIPIDGPARIVGSAGPCLVDEFYRSRFATIEFDLADVESMVDLGTFYNVVLHETAHCLGAGSLWEADTLYGRSVPALVGSEVLPGPLGGYEYVGKYGNIGNEQVGRTGSAIVEDTGGKGTARGHWKEDVYDNELMTSYAELVGTPMPISLLTLQALRDLGFANVDLSKADPYTAPTLPLAQRRRRLRTTALRLTGCINNNTLSQVKTFAKPGRERNYLEEKAEHEDLLFRMKAAGLRPRHLAHRH